MSTRYPTTDAELKTAVRAETQYEDTTDELPDSDLDTLVERAKAKVELETGSSKWYSDDGLGFALVAYTCMRAKAAMENATIERYTLGDHSVTVHNADPDTSQQIQQWGDDVRTGLNASSADTSQRPTMKNTSGYIGESYYDTGSTN